MNKLIALLEYLSDVVGYVGPPMELLGKLTHYVLKLITGAIGKISTIFGYIAAPLPFLAGVIIFYEIVMRKFFNSPTLWVSETTAMLCGICYLLGGALTMKNDGHVRVDIIYSRFGKRGKSILDCFNFCFIALYLVVMLRVIWPYMVQSIKLNEHSWTAWNPMVWPMKVILFFGFCLVALQAISKLIQDLYMAITGRPL
ncbi:MAG: TRAP transporter small permease subunit [Deltaproteobacteria bacterium]|jgi:TRAP-type mannitol/chloroaromatic compound transport system permease small subunit|nr:TRAP transporter small permease subunit [Deltaproteobacteria bacterium]